jgi:hypothetical protein
LALADPNDLWPELDQLGEAEVRRRLLLNAYSHTKVPAVQAWLEKKEAERQEQASERDRLLRNQEVAILRSTRNAAWVAALAALLSMIFAGIAICYSRG